jgi:hypothetical protein
MALHDGIRKIIVEELISQNSDVIISYCPTSWESDDRFWKIIFKKIRSKGRIYFVRLECEQEEMLNRVVHEGRKGFTKVKSRKELRKVIESTNMKPWKWKFNHDYLGNKSLVIDNTNLSAKSVSNIIKKEYKL